MTGMTGMTGETGETGVTASSPSSPGTWARSCGALVRAECTRLAGRRFPWVLPAVGVALLVLSIVGTASSETTGAAGPVDAAALTDLAFGLSFSMVLFALLFGALVVTTDVQARTLGATVLAVPARGAVVTQKALTAAVAGAAYGALGVAAGYGATSVALALNGLTPTWTPASRDLALFIPLITAVAGPLGVAVGLVVRATVAAALGLTVWTLVAEPALVHLVPAVGRWLPAGGYAAVMDDPAVPERLGRPAGVAVLALWLGGGLAAALVAFRRRPL